MKDSLKFLPVILFCGATALLTGQDKPTIDWIDIPSGTFIMGSPEDELKREDSEKQHEVKIRSFKMSPYEITVGQFKAFVDATDYVTDAEKGTGGSTGSAMWGGKKFRFKAGIDWTCDEKGNPRPETEYNHPVVHVSWNDAKAFADWMGCRLPTEAEWEYACRAGTTSPFHTGERLTSEMANFDGNYPYNDTAKGVFHDRTMPVGSYQPNAWGLYDMHGNVWEWCSDWYGEYPSDRQVNPAGPETGTTKVRRGGGWGYDGRKCRSAVRDSYDPGFRSRSVGFRVAR